ncbi:baseplate J/gp47 family protein, partial [Mangrovimonas futianensis]|uniref:baseplate J/gp47 family protein n=1 Tax=Mangrovimonas futianensis TaxID=2895523 RepID=UPI00300C3B15
MNNYGIVNGSDQESDDRFRFRIANSLVAAEQANFTSVRLAALSVPGVADVQFVNGVNGTASFDLYVKALSTEPSVGLLGSVQAAVELVTAFPIRVFVRAPLLVGLEFFLHLNLRSDIE